MNKFIVDEINSEKKTKKRKKFYIDKMSIFFPNRFSRTMHS